MTETRDGIASPTILLLEPQLANVGNDVIARGARALVENAYPNATIVTSSSYPYYLADVAVENGGDDALRRRTVGIGELVDPDLVVWPGCNLYPDSLRQHIPLLQSFDVPVVMLGAGGNDYEPETVATVSDQLRDAGVDLLIARDRTAAEAYDKVVPARQGIDCGFWIDEWHTPPQRDERFVVATFDKTDREVESDFPVIRPHHAPFDLLRDVYEGGGVAGRALRLARRFTSPNDLQNAYDELRDGRLFVSDRVEDYLYLYANAVRVDTDRLHATVPALVYRTPVSFDYDTERAGLLDGLVTETAGGIAIEDATLEWAKRDQEKWLARVLDTGRERAGIPRRGAPGGPAS